VVHALPLGLQVALVELACSHLGAWQRRQQVCHYYSPWWWRWWVGVVLAGETNTRVDEWQVAIGGLGDAGEAACMCRG
jgi:hypothetical protein